MVIIIRQVVLVVCRHQLNDTTSRLRLFTGYMPRLDPPSHSITNNTCSTGMLHRNIPIWNVKHSKSLIC